MTRRTKIWAWVLLAIVAAPALALVTFLLTFDPNAYAPDLIAGIEAATGRQVTIGSRLTIGLSFTPTIEADQISLANPLGFHDPNVVNLQKIEAKISLLKLLSHQVDIERLLLVGPVVTLERNQAGQADWDFSKPRPATAAAPGGQVTPPAARNPYKVTLEAVQIQSGQLILKDPTGAQTGTLSLPQLTGQADSASAPLNIAANAIYNGIPFTANGRLGPIERFSGIGAGPWPVDLSFAANGATATVNGTFAHPRESAGYDLDVTAAIPALAALQPLAGATTLPPLQNLTAAAHLADQNAPMPAITALFIKAGASDLSSIRPNFSVQNIDIEMPSLSRPVTINVTGSLDNAPLSITGTIGAVAALLNPAWLPAAAPVAVTQGAPVYPVNITMQAAGANIAITGGAATPNGMAGVALGVNATIPDLGALSPLAGIALPAWKNIALQTTITDPGGLGLQKAAGLEGLTLKMDNAVLGGDASLYFGPQPKFQATLKAGQINLDALLAALPTPAPPAGPAPAQSGQAPPAPATRPDFTQSALKLPVKLMQSASADVQVSIDSLVLNKATYTALQTHAVLANGVLTISPLTAILPGGGIAANATVDVTKTPPAETVSINAPALALAPFLRAIDIPDDAQGTLQASLNATGAGVTPHDFFSSVNGQLGLAAVNGVVDGAVLDALFGAVLRAVDLPDSIIGAQGPVPVRCFALRIDSAAGLGTIRALTLDSSRLTIQGGGTVNFGDESLGIIMRPQLSIAGAQVGVPVQIGGTFENPTTAIAPLSAVQAAAKAALGLPVTIAQQGAAPNSVLGKIVNGLGLGQALAQAEPDICPAALALGRLGAAGPAPESPAAMTAPTSGAAPTAGPQNLLNSLFGK